MPKKKKPPRRPPVAMTRPKLRPSSRPALWAPTPSDAAVAASRGLSSVSDELWERLRADFLATTPVCPDCGGDWALEVATEEEGVTFDGKHVISLTVRCEEYDDDPQEDDYRDPVPHPITDGIAYHELEVPA